MLKFVASLSPEIQASIFTGIGACLLAFAAYVTAKAKKLGEGEATARANDDARHNAQEVISLLEDCRDLLSQIDKTTAQTVTILTMVGRRD